MIRRLGSKPMTAAERQARRREQFRIMRAALEQIATFTPRVGENPDYVEGFNNGRQAAADIAREALDACQQPANSQQNDPGARQKN